MKETDSTMVQVAGHSVAHGVVSNIQQASKDSGISFSYLMAQAGGESSFKTEVSSHSSSAAGLFQFTKGTWLSLIKAHGADHGLGDMADQIHHSAHGEYVVNDAATRQKILDLRRDPEISAQMAGAYAKDNKARLEKSLGRPVDSTDLYMAHFLGPGGAAKVLKARDEDPAQPAAALVPQAAHKNPTVFYDTQHSARSVAAVYDRIHHSIEKPMKQYARLEEPATATAQAGAGVYSAHAHHKAHGAGRHAATAVASNEPDPQWPFETGQWPPTHLPTPKVTPTANADAAATVEPVAEAAEPGDWQSADRVSAPMPPPAGETPADHDKGGLGKLFTNVKKSLFG
ncbi:MAG TPA: lytic transglycosylase domain-containing protein [Patescibacteria group bacterium]|nr:lytic transglycosylase domain-containing protein [Patescibacteria group bacterium]